MNASGWWVVGLLMGALITVAVYELERRATQRAAQYWEDRCQELAEQYTARVLELEKKHASGL